MTGEIYKLLKCIYEKLCDINNNSVIDATFINDSNNIVHYKSSNSLTTIGYSSKIKFSQIKSPQKQWDLTDGVLTIKIDKNFNPLANIIYNIVFVSNGIYKLIQ